MDIDNFKSINDTYGHDNGDKVILAIADIVRTINNDNTIFVSRYGGEEFAFIFINTPKTNVIESLQKIRSSVCNLAFDFDEKKVVTMSGGLFECDTCTYSVENIFNNADTALYYAKEHGKNQLIIYNELEQNSEEFCIQS
jgi:diguanylate cyclase (GGDEF)-like protein